MEREQGREGQRAHVLVVPFPTQGHISPMIQFSKRLAAKGLKVTVITVSDKPAQPYEIEYSITVVTASNGLQGGEHAPTVEESLERLDKSMKISLCEFIDKEKRSDESDRPLKALVYDAAMPWALDVAREFGLCSAVFFTQSWSVSAIYYHIHQGSYRVDSLRDDRMTLSSFPSLPLLRAKDLPAFVRESGSYLPLLKLLVNQFLNFKEADFILSNTFDKLEDKVMKWMEGKWKVRNIGPTIPSMFLDKRLEDDKEYGFSLFKPNVDDCLKWLDSKQASSVIYVSFGSLAALEDEQMKELALGLKQSGYNFLWVVRESETNKIPDKYSEEVSDKGLIVNWSPQLQVLAHKSVGCFVTHCGWNSTLEALSMGVPMVAMPQWTDQPTNAKLIEDAWKVGVRVTEAENGFVTKGEMLGCIKEIMEGEKGEEVKRNAEKWKALAKEALSQGGSSEKNIEELVAKLACG